MKLRPPSTVMRLSRMGAMHATRLSFMPTFLRNARQKGWKFEQTKWEINEQGVGYATYQVDMCCRKYTLICFAHDLPDDLRSDRVIATAWDATFTLHDGVPSDTDIHRLSEQVPKQEAGRISSKELVLSRANRSSRMWSHVIDRLASGRQPDKELVQQVGYLMRTTAVYGSGKFGAADRIDIRDRPEFLSSFQVEMLSVFLIREFVLDLADYMALMKGGDQAVPMTHEIRRMFGIGNSTGLGMAPFLVNHPALLHRWMLARETALAKVREQKSITDADRRLVQAKLIAALANAKSWSTPDDKQTKATAKLCSDLEKILIYFSQLKQVSNLWDHLVKWSEAHCDEEAQEQLISCIMEPYGWLVDDLTKEMQIAEEKLPRLDGTQPCGALKKQIKSQYDWALKLDFDQSSENARFWYYSQNKLEPRLGERAEEEGAELEFPLCIARDVHQLYKALPDKGLVADFLLSNPKFRFMAHRVQALAEFPYAEIQDNLLCQDFRPVDMLRCKLSLFGATKFDPRSDRWLRIVMYQDAPLAADLMAHEALFADAS